MCEISVVPWQVQREQVRTCNLWILMSATSSGVCLIKQSIKGTSSSNTCSTSDSLWVWPDLYSAVLTSWSLALGAAPECPQLLSDADYWRLHRTDSGWPPHSPSPAAETSWNVLPQSAPHGSSWNLTESRLVNELQHFTFHSCYVQSCVCHRCSIS